MSISVDQLLNIMPHATTRSEVWITPINEAMREFGIDNGLREAAFLATIAHESGELKYVRELWGPTSSQERYERDFSYPYPPTRDDQTNSLAFRLGNSQKGDGFRYRGRGLIQITGRNNYSKCGDGLGLDLIGTPNLLEDPRNASRSAGWFWETKGLNELADRESFGMITKRVNGGMNGWKERCQFYERAKNVIGL